MGASFAVTMEWSDRELNLRAIACQDQQSSAGTATPSSLVLEVLEWCVLSVPSRRSERCSPKRAWISTAIVSSSMSLGRSRSMLKSPQKYDRPAKLQILAAMARSVLRR
eukprot:796997-Heterocapsa_arctica.AAC.1